MSDLIALITEQYAIFDEPLTLDVDFDTGALMNNALASIPPNNTTLLGVTPAKEEHCMGNFNTLTTEYYALLDFMLILPQRLT